MSMFKKLEDLLFSAPTLKSRIFKILIIFTVIPFLLITIYVFIYTNQRITKEYYDDITIKLNECNGIINGKMDEYIDKSSYIITNQYLIKNMQNDFSNDLEKMMSFLDIVGAMIGEPFNFSDKRPFIIYFYNETLYEGKFVDNINSIIETELTIEAMQSSAAKIIWAKSLAIKSNKKYLTFYRNIIDYKDSIGILEVNIPYVDIEMVLDTIGTPEKGLFLSANDLGEVMYLNNQTDMEIKDINSITSKDYLIVSSTLKNGHIIKAAIPKKEVFKDNLRIFSYLVASLMIYTLVALLVTRVTTRRITGSLEDFVNQIKISDNLLLNEEQIQITGDNEISFIQQKFKELISRMNKIYTEMMNIKLENSSLEIELLQSRINPHLLYNSLSVIKWNALWNKDQKTVEMIDTMTKYYRTALNKGNSIITVASELEMIKEYVKINVFAHSAGYTLEIDVEERVLPYHTLKHLLQPIVENSILHGLKGKTGDAQIDIRGYMNGKDIVFEIQDNGRGIAQEDIDDIMSLNYSASYGGYGIRNLIKRIQAYYGSKYFIKIDSEIDIGTKVTVTIEALNEVELKKRIQSNVSLS